MTRNVSSMVANNRRFIPLSVTILLFFVVYAIGMAFYPGMRDPQVFFNLFRTSPFLLISAIGMTFVIISGGIDLSVSGVIALVTVASAALLRDAGWNPWAVITAMLAMGMAIGAIMGAFITYMKVQPFIATLAGMWIARGLCFFISDDAIAINNWTYKVLGQTKILIPGLADPVTKKGDYISILVVVGLLVLAAAMFIAHLTRFGRTVYAMGGSEFSARLMGLPVNTTKVFVYTLNGFCSALAGITLSIYVLSGHGLYAQGFELTVIASVVIGGTMLTGGAGYVFGTLFGVLITGLIQALILFNGKLSSWWTSIAVGVLMLIFIGVQSLLAARRGRLAAARRGEAGRVRPGAPALGRRQLVWAAGGIAVIVILAAGSVINRARSSSLATAGTSAAPVAGCSLKAYRQDQAAALIQGGAIVAYERNGGPGCIDELYAIYPDGRIVGDDGANKLEKQLTTADVATLLTTIADRGWFTENMYDTWHTPCGQCFGYYLTVSSNGKQKTVKAVDGGTDAPADYWQVISTLNGVIPHFNTSE
jgi:ribose/xylose/arabinose/galactoside ABC-type transport system permease subunit